MGIFMPEGINISTTGTGTASAALPPHPGGEFTSIRYWAWFTPRALDEWVAIVSERFASEGHVVTVITHPRRFGVLHQRTVVIDGGREGSDLARAVIATVDSRTGADVGLLAYEREAGARRRTRVLSQFGASVTPDCATKPASAAEIAAWEVEVAPLKEAAREEAFRFASESARAQAAEAARADGEELGALTSKDVVSVDEQFGWRRGAVYNVTATVRCSHVGAPAGVLSA